MSYRHAMGLTTAPKTSSTSTTAHDVSEVIGASSTGVAAILSAILGRSSSSSSTPAPGPVETPAPDYSAQIPAPSSSSWILPVAIIGGALLLGGIVVMAVGKKKSVSPNRRRRSRRVRRNKKHDPLQVVFEPFMQRYAVTLHGQPVKRFKSRDEAHRELERLRATGERPEPIEAHRAGYVANRRRRR